MSESVLADFFGRFHAHTTPSEKPVSGRIVCSGRRLVLAMDSESTIQIPLASIMDIGVGTVPSKLEEFFDSTVTIAYERDGQSRLAAVEADTEDIRKFATVLFGAILEGTTVSLRHPAVLDGRLQSHPFRSATLGIARTAVAFRGDPETVSIDLGDVIGFGRSSAEIDGADRPVVEIVTEADGQSVTSYIGGASSRKLSLLGRYLRIEYAEAAAEARDLNLEEVATRTLLTTYAIEGETDIDVPAIVETDAETLAAVREELVGAGLLVAADPGSPLTQLGRIAAESAATDVA
ncbi:MAG: CheF family chemotaxis protein [Salinirussus sp.]